jgi:hypothetical protein
MLFGLKGDVQGNLFYYDDQRVIYPVGHNVVIYNVDEKTQQYIPGKEGHMIDLNEYDRYRWI